MNTFNNPFANFAWALAGAALLAGCQHGSSGRQATSVVNYLYPKQASHVEVPGIPMLALPLKVGVAFVPEDHERNRYVPSGLLSENQRIALIKEVSESFKKYPFVKSIDIIPSAYLTPRGGFPNLDQLRTIFDVDVIALLSYDQAQFTDAGLLSLTYWTLVGAYVVQAEKNDTQTMLDAAVYDIKSRKLLFRAPGTSRVKHSTTPINLSEALRRDGEAGFKIAATNMVASLHQELDSFREKVKKAPDEYKVVHRPGYTGGGSVGGIEAILLAGLGTLWLCRQRAGPD